MKEKMEEKINEIKEHTVGDITVRYNASDYDKKKSRKHTTKEVIIMVIAIIAIMVSCVYTMTVLDKYLDSIFLQVLIECVYLILTIGGLMFYCIKISYRKFIPAFATIDWMLEFKDVDADYYKGYILFRITGSNGVYDRFIKGMMYDVKAKYTVDDAGIDKAKPIHVTFDFTIPNDYYIRVRNKELYYVE